MSSLMDKLNHTAAVKENIRNAINTLVLRSNLTPSIDLDIPFNEYAQTLDIPGWSYLDNINLCNYRIHIKYAFPQSSTLLQFDTTEWLGSNNIESIIVGPKYDTIEEYAPRGEYIQTLRPDGWSSSGSSGRFYPEFYHMSHIAPNGGGGGGTVTRDKNSTYQYISFTRQSWDHFYVRVVNHTEKFFVGNKQDLDQAYLLILLCNT